MSETLEPETAVPAAVISESREGGRQSRSISRDSTAASQEPNRCSRAPAGRTGPENRPGCKFCNPSFVG